MAQPREQRVAVGSPDYRRSTVWKFSVQGDECYIFSRMMGSDTKVSLHSTGECQWSATGKWVLKVAGRTNAERHFRKWFMPRTFNGNAVHMFQVRIPETELRQIELPENHNAVEWLPPPPAGKTLSLECYITAPAPTKPFWDSRLALSHLCSLPLASNRWFVIFHHVVHLDGKELNPLRAQLNAMAREAGIAPNPKHRGLAFTESDGTAKGFIEICTVGP